MSNPVSPTPPPRYDRGFTEPSSRGPSPSDSSSYDDHKMHGTRYRSSYREDIYRTSTLSSYSSSSISSMSYSSSSSSSTSSSSSSSSSSSMSNPYSSLSSYFSSTDLEPAFESSSSIVSKWQKEDDNNFDLDPITLEKMTDPVIDQAGHTFDRSTINDLVIQAKKKGESGKRITCPYGREVIVVARLVPNRFAIDAIERVDREVAEREEFLSTLIEELLQWRNYLNGWHRSLLRSLN